MWPFKRKVHRRRLEVRKNIPSQRAPRWRRFRDAGGLGSALLGGAFFVVLVMLDLTPAEPLPYRPGQYVAEDIHARLDFSVLSPDRQRELQREAQVTTPPVFRLNTALADEVTATLKNLPDQLKATTQPGDLDETLGERFALTAQNVLKVREALVDPQRREGYQRHLERLRKELAGTFFVRPKALEFQIWRSADEAVILQDHSSTRKGMSELISLTDRSRVPARIASLAAIFAPEVRPHVEAYLKRVLSGSRAIYEYDAARTQADIARAQLAIEADPPPEAYVKYARGQVLVRSSRRQTAGRQTIAPLTVAERDLLVEEHRAYLRAEERMHPWWKWSKPAGRAAILLLITALMGLYIAHYEQGIVRNHWRGAALALVLLVMLCVSKAAVFAAQFNVHSALFATLLGGVILTIAYDQRFALTIGAVLAVLTVLQLRGDFAMLVVLLSGLSFSVFELHEIRSRSKLIEVAAIAAAAVFLVVCALGLAGAVPWRFVLVDGMWAAGAALLAGLLIQAILPVIERVFGIATSMTLLEWCDASRPLLKRLAMEAPGTYNHSLQLGAMCEAAAEAIGARGLLARVGAYYHDIGKINKPAYFVENQTGSASKHEKLSPAMSLLIIIGHVKDGLEMAREYGLPSALHEFVAAHHGTTLVEYFYHAATRQVKGGADRAPEEVEFRYPGPKPRAKEAAILMLADAAESSVRAMTEPTPGRIENQVHTMVSRRLMDGQLDECDMTLKEVHQVESSLVKSLCGIYHARIAYPTPAEQKLAASHADAQAKGRPAGPQDQGPVQQPEADQAPSHE